MRRIVVVLLALSGLFVAAPAANAAQVNAPLVGGDQFVHNGMRCIVGFNVVNQAQQHHVLTAGPCAQPGRAYGIVPAPAGSTPTPYVRMGGVLHRVEGSTVPPVGARVCMSASSTGVRCGSVLAHNQTVCFPQGCVTGLSRTNLCLSAGQAGSPVVSTGARFLAVGVLVAGSGSCSTGGTSWYQPVGTALGPNGFRLYL